MKKTGSLKFTITFALDRECLIMHPDEGFELGLMRVTHHVRLCRNLDLESYLKGMEGDVEFVKLQLHNDCPRETIQVGRTLHHLLGKPEKAIALFDGQRLFLHTVS